MIHHFLRNINIQISIYSFSRVVIIKSFKDFIIQIFRFYFLWNNIDIDVNSITDYILNNREIKVNENIKRKFSSAKNQNKIYFYLYMDRSLIKTIITILVLSVIFVVFQNIMKFLNIETSKYIFILTWFIALCIFFYILPEYEYF